MEWKDEFSVGIPEIDAQHQTLAGCIALVQDAVKSQQRWSAAHSALVQLADFVRIHFAVEESLMRTRGHPELGRHIREHMDFADELRRLQEGALRVDVSEEMVAFIQTWMHEHILTSDKHYAAYLPTAGVVRTVQSELSNRSTDGP